MIHNGTDFAEIRRDHPDLHTHKYYKPWDFPRDISNFLPSLAERWWDRLGKSGPTFSCFFSPPYIAARARQVAAAKVDLPVQPKPTPNEPGDIEDVDELMEDDYLPVSN